MTANSALPLRRPLILLALAVAAILATASAPASAATINVKTTSDEFATGTNCSLRQAIESANTDTAFGGCTSGSGADTIKLKGGARYIRELPGPAAEDENAAGDYDVKSEITLSVKGKGKAEINGGGLDRVFQIFAGAKLTGSDLVVRDGDVFSAQPSGDTGGGGILDNGTLVLSHSVVTYNRALGNMQCNCGGGIYVRGVATLERVKVRTNTASNVGGGIAWTGGKLRVVESTISGNFADSSGGGFYLGGGLAPNVVTIRKSTIFGNQSHATGGNFGGGAISVSDFDDSKLTATNVTIHGNSADANGGGVWVYSGEIKLNSATVTQNTSVAAGGTVGGGGGLAGSVEATNSIIARNHNLNPATVGSTDCYINVSVSFSLVGKDTGCEGGENRSTKAPKLVRLADNGGPTLTVALGKKSPAIGHAKKSIAPGKDQRGRKRDSKPDLGAYERLPKRHRH